MNTLKILSAAVAATFALAAQAAPGGPNCPAGAAPGSVECTCQGGPCGARGGPGGPGGPQSAKMLERLKAADTNADGMISRDEAKAALPRIHEHFDAIDTNRDGLISFEELQKARQAQRGGGQRGEGWRKWDADGDGKLSREEVAKAPRLAQEFDAIDTNKDGFLSPEELQAAHQRYAGRGR